MSAAALRILFVEDLPEDYEIAVKALDRAEMEFEHRRVDTAEAFAAALDEFGPDIVVSDYSMPRFDGMSALKMAQERDRLLPFIMLTGAMNEDTAVACMKAGAMDYLIKGQSSRLPFAIREAIERSRLSREKESIDTALRESEQKLRTLADSGQALIWTADTLGRCDYFNRTWLDFTGRPQRSEFGDGWTAGVHPDDLSRCLASYAEAAERRNKFSREYRLRRRDGEYRWVQDDGCPRYDATGAFIGYIGYCLDITDRKTTEARILQALAEKETLLREVFHRTRNSMQVILALLAFEDESIQDRRVSEVVKKTSDRIMSMALVHQKLYQSQDLSRVDLKEYTEDLLGTLFGNDPTLDQRISVTMALEPAAVLIDAAVPYGLVLHELVSNSLRHAFPDGRRGKLTVRISKREKEGIELEIADDGVGLPEDFARRCSKTVGMNLVRGLIEQQLRGSVELSTGPGLSCRVRFSDALFMKRV